jgi:hypothetical protein
MVYRYVLSVLLMVLSLTAPVFAGDHADIKVYSTDGIFEDVTADVEDAIITRGFNIDYHGFIGNMLKRTAKDVGSEKVVYKNAEFFQFCSATLSRKTMEADPRNIGYCPYIIFVYELPKKPNTIYAGYRRLGGGDTEKSRTALTAVEKVLDAIVQEATQ